MPGKAERIQFLITGVQKGGTTALDSVLRDHPSIQMARVKEIHHFDDDTIDWSAPDHGRLHAAYDWAATGAVRGEATPITLYRPNALKRLRSYDPRAKLLIGLRNPAFRAFSQLVRAVIPDRRGRQYIDLVADLTYQADPRCSYLSPVRSF